jgi:hypothetical protein
MLIVSKKRIVLFKLVSKYCASCKFVEPIEQYIVAIPINKKQEAKEPSTKYFIPASVEKAEFLLKLASAYKHKL